MSRRDPDSINAAAAEWIARLDRGQLCPEAQVELEEWLSADRRHEGAFLRAQSAWTMIDRAAIPFDRPDDAIDSPIRRRTTRRAFVYGGGGVIAASAIGGLLLRNWQAPARFTTMAGEIRRLPLKDGSVATVNTEAALTASLSGHRRLISLEKGEAWFQVAKDEGRPFIVEAGPVRVRAIGTSFSVKRTATAAEVQVTHGVIETWSEGNSARLRVSAGSRVNVDAIAGPEIKPASIEEIERSLSWRFGELIFDGESLAEAVAEFNRYNEIRIIIDDPQIAKKPIVGRFRSNEPEAFAASVAAVFNAETSRQANDIRITRPAGP